MNELPPPWNDHVHASMAFNRCLPRKFQIFVARLRIFRAPIAMQEARRFGGHEARGSSAKEIQIAWGWRRGLHDME